MACALVLMPSNAVAAAFDRSLTVGAVGADVTELQLMLRAEGFYQFPEITGYFGPITAQAVAAFQRAQGLEGVGIVGPKTRAILNERIAGTAPSLSQLVSTLQRLLKEAGYYSNPSITGVFDLSTQAALQAYLDTANAPGAETSATPRTPARRSGGGGGGSDNDEADTTAPVISSISSGTPSDIAASITWTTDEAADTQIAYGTTAAYGATTTLDTTLVTSHTVNLTGLSASTTYHYRVRSADGNANVAYSSDQTFTTSTTPDTTAPLISSIASSTSATTATITWTTDEASDSRVDYGATSSYGTASTSASLVTSHSVQLTGLTAATTYHFRVQSADGQGNTATSSDVTFTTSAAADTTAPLISSVASSTTATTATISWTTNEAATSTVQYGATSSYGTASTSASLVTSHSIQLSGLTGGTLYHFQVASQDAAGNVATSSDLTFTTDVDTYEGLVATRVRTMTTTAANTRLMSRYALVATDDISAARVVFQNFRVTSSASAEQDNGADTTVTASIEYPANTFTQLLFSGTATGTIPAGGVLFSDSATVSIPAGATFWVREYNINSTGTFYNAVRNSSLGDLMNAGSSLTDQTMGGTITNLGTFSHPPLAVLAQTDEPSVCIIGDSIAWGTNDTDTAADGRKGIIAKSFPTDLAFVNLASPGSRANTYLSASETAARQELFPYCTHVVSELGNNDLHVSGNSTTTLIANLQTIWDAFPAGTKITQTTITPKTSSTDSWATTVNQTSGNSAHRAPFNDLLRDGSIAGVNNGFFDIANALETALNSGIWRVDGTAFKYTSDGLHPTAAGYDLVVTDGAIDTSIFTYP